MQCNAGPESGAIEVQYRPRNLKITGLTVNVFGTGRFSDWIRVTQVK